MRLFWLALGMWTVISATELPHGGPPRIWTDAPEGQWYRVITDGFPAGAPASDLTAWLRAEGFFVEDGEARYAWPRTRCNTQLTVTWTEDGQGRIVEVGAESLQCGCILGGG